MATGTVAITAPHKGTLAVRGMGGAGKSVLANAVARDEEIRRHFTDGIFWVTVGQENTRETAKVEAILYGIRLNRLSSRYEATAGRYAGLRIISSQHAVEDPRLEERLIRRLAHWKSMQTKYERAARYPWLPVAPDAPEPE